MASRKDELATAFNGSFTRPPGFSISAPQVELLLTSAIRTDGGTQARAGLNDATVAEYQEAYNDGADLPPIVVYFDGESYWLADGFHRINAWQRSTRRLGAISCTIHQGTRRDAVLAACGANAKHGLRRTRDDVQRAVEMLLRDDEWVQWSDREIGRRCACSPTTVGTARTRLEATVQIGQSETRIGGDGRTTRPAGRANGSGGSRNGSGGGSWSAEPADVAATRTRVEAIGGTFHGTPNARGQYRVILPDREWLGTITELQYHIAARERTASADVTVTPIPLSDVRSEPVDDRAPLYRKRLRDAFRDDDEQAEGIAALALGCHLLGIPRDQFETALADVLDDETYELLIGVLS